MATQPNEEVRDTRFDTLVLKGGGVKGLALIGAMEILEPHFRFETYSGTSAGAIAATLLAAGFTSLDLKKCLLDKDFRDFLDASLPGAMWNLLTEFGLYKGDSFHRWMTKLLRQKLDADPILLNHLSPKRLVIFASDAGYGTLRLDSKAANRDTEAAFAARLSMSIPFVFTPQYWQGRRVYDGGLLNNFPLKEMMRQLPDSKILGLYLGSRDDDVNKRRFPGSDLLRLLLMQDELQILEQNRDRIIVIDPSPVGTLDFRLSPVEKEYLLAEGRIAATRFLIEQHVIPMSRQEQLDDLIAGQKGRLARVIKIRHRRRRESYAKVLIFVLFAIGAIYLGERAASHSDRIQTTRTGSAPAGKPTEKEGTTAIPANKEPPREKIEGDKAALSDALGRSGAKLKGNTPHPDSALAGPSQETSLPQPASVTAGNNVPALVGASPTTGSTSTQAAPATGQPVCGYSTKQEVIDSLKKEQCNPSNKDSLSNWYIQCASISHGPRGGKSDQDVRNALLAVLGPNTNSGKCLGLPQPKSGIVFKGCNNKTVAITDGIGARTADNGRIEVLDLVPGSHTARLVNPPNFIDKEFDSLEIEPGIVLERDCELKPNLNTMWMSEPLSSVPDAVKAACSFLATAPHPFREVMLVPNNAPRKSDVKFSLRGPPWDHPCELADIHEDQRGTKLTGTVKVVNVEDATILLTVTAAGDQLNGQITDLKTGMVTLISFRRYSKWGR